MQKYRMLGVRAFVLVRGCGLLWPDESLSRLRSTWRRHTPTVTNTIAHIYTIKSTLHLHYIDTFIGMRGWIDPIPNTSNPLFAWKNVQKIPAIKSHHVHFLISHAEVCRRKLRGWGRRGRDWRAYRAGALDGYLFLSISAGYLFLQKKSWQTLRWNTHGGTEGSRMMMKLKDPCASLPGSGLLSSLFEILRPTFFSLLVARLSFPLNPFVFCLV